MSRRRVRRPKPTTDKRTPEERLEAMIREPNHDRATRMLIRIREDLDATPEPGPWVAAARTLSDRLIISFDAVYYFAELFTECLVLAASGTDSELVRIESEMTTLERAHGLREGEYWDPDDAPEDWRALNDAWDEWSNAIVASALRTYGHADIADVFEMQPAEFERRSEKGRVDVWGEDDKYDDEE